MPERSLVLFVATVTFVTGAWLATRSPTPLPAHEPVVVATPLRWARVSGRLIDEGGLPVPDASVQLFAHAGVWLDGEPGCAVSLLACDDFDAGREVLRRLDAGTLEFPEPLAVGATDEAGAFSFADVPPDTFVVAWAERVAIERVEDGGLPTLQLGDDERTFIVLDGRHFPDDVAVVAVSPFTRMSGELRTVDGRASASGYGARWAWAVAVGDGGMSTVVRPSSKSLLHVGEPRRLVVRLDGGATLSGTLSLQCEEYRREAPVVGGLAVFEGVLGPCTAQGALGDFDAVERQRIADDAREVTLQVSPLARLEVALLGAPLEDGEVVVGPPVTTGFELFSGDWRSAPVQGRVARLTRVAVGEREVTVRGRGVLTAKQLVVLKRGVKRLAITLTASRRLRGVVVDAAGQPLPGVEVQALEATNRFLAQRESDARGRFEFDVADEAPVRLEVRDPAHGELVTVVDPQQPATLRLAPERRLFVRLLAPDGGQARGEVRALGEELPQLALDELRRAETLPAPVELDDGEGPSRRLVEDDAGVWRWWGVPAGRHVLRATAPGIGGVTREVQVPDAGDVTLELALPNAEVLQGVLLVNGEPGAGLHVSLDPRRHVFGGPAVTTNAAGRFRFEGVEPGPHQLVFVNDAAVRHEVDVAAPALELRVDWRQ